MEQFSFSKNEEQILEHWKHINLYSDKIVNKNKNGPFFNFQDGPPFVSSANLHFGHIHISVMKSFLVNFLNMHGYNVANKSGKDCHGLPIEMIVSENLGLKTNDDIKNYGLANYNNKCAETINNYSKSWTPIFDRIGRFIDDNNEYYTMDLNFMESIWWAWKSLYEKGLVYKGYKIMPYSTACGTSLSTSEASGDDVYKIVSDPAIYVKFQLLNENNVYIIVWTTTPWTLPSNLAIAINPTFEYVKICDSKTGQHFILAKSCLEKLYGKQKKDSKEILYTIIETFLGKDLENTEYIPLFDYYAKNRSFKILMGDFVEQGSGTGAVHLAPSFGTDDFDICIAKNIVTVENVGDYCPIDDNGFFIHPITEYVGQHVLQTNNLIIDRLKQEQKLIKKEMYAHKYPFCWRTDTPLIYKVVSSYFVKVSSIKEKMVENNNKSNWVPENIGSGRFKQWLENAKDWGVSRSRFFGTPIPMWVSDDGKETICIGSIDELVLLANLTERPTNLHPQYMNDIMIPSKEGRGMLKRVAAVYDCWFESGCAPFAQLHYPFENKNFFDNKPFLSDFICEGLDQTRGWFYTLTVLSTALFDKPAFDNVICSGLILAEDGKKFSKRLGNFVSPLGVCDEYGADSLRLYLAGSPAAHGEPFKFKNADIKDINGKYFQLYNSFNFLMENLTKYEKDGHVFNINDYLKGTNTMDNWMLAKLRTSINNITTFMKNYEFYKIKSEILDFIEDLTNWYIKFNRNRLRGRFCVPEEQGCALSSLYRVIMTFSKIICPFVPFLAETIYKKLSQLLPINEQKESVHLCEYPNVNDFIDDPNVERRMKRLQEVCKMVRNLRDKTTTATSIKVPLKTVTIVNEDQEFIDDLKVLERYLHEEINALTVRYLQTYGDVTYKLEPNNKELGISFKKDAKLIKMKLDELPQEQFLEYVSNGNTSIMLHINGKDMNVNNTFFTIIKNNSLLLETYELSVNTGKTTIIIDHTYDDKIHALYTKRLLISGIQQIRKTTNLKPWNKIAIYYETFEQIIQVFLKYKDDIEKELDYPVLPMEYSINMMPTIVSKFNIKDDKVIILIKDVDGTSFGTNL